MTEGQLAIFCIEHDERTAVKAPAKVNSRRAHTQSRTRLASVSFLSAPLHSSLDGDDSPGVKGCQNDNPMIMVRYFGGSVGNR